MARVRQHVPPSSAGVVDLDGQHTLEHALDAELAELARFKTRKQLLRSELYRRLAPTLDRLGFGMEYSRSERWDVAARESVRVVAWNIQRGIHFDGIAEALATEAELARADVLMLLESDLGMARSGNRNVARELAGRLGFDYVYGNSYLCLSAGNRREASQVGPDTLALSGNAILSRLPLTRAENFTVAIMKDKFESSEKRLGHKKALWAEVAIGTKRLAIAAVHLDSAASSAGRRCNWPT